MPTYLITAPDGQKIKVTGPGSEAEAIAHAQQTYQAQPQQGLRDIAAGLDTGDMSAYNPAPQEPLTLHDRWRDAVHSTGTGIIGGVTGIGDIGFGLDKWARGTRFGPLYEKANAVLNPLGEAASQALQPEGAPAFSPSALAEKVAPGSVDYTPKTGVGTALQRIAEFGVGSPVKGALKSVVVPALASIAGEKVTKGTKYEPYGALLGAGAGIAAAPTLAKLLGRTISPFAASEANRIAAATLKKAGVPITAGQKSGSAMLRAFEEEAGGMTAQRFHESQLEKFSAAQLKEIDPRITETRATEDVFKHIDNHFNTEFKRLGHNAVVPDTEYFQNMGDALRHYTSHVPQSQQISAVQNWVADMAAAGRRGADAEVYQGLRSRLERMRRNATDPEAKQAFSDLREGIDNLMERSIAKTNPGDLEAYRKVRSQYRHALAVEDAASRAGSGAASGLLTPSNMASALKRVYGDKAWNRGSTQAIRVAKAAAQVMTPMANSNTALRLAARGAAHAPLSLAGGLYGWSQGDGGLEGAMMAAGGAMAGKAVRTLGAKTLFSGPGRALLGNQVAADLARTKGWTRTLLPHVVAPARRLLGP